MPKYTDFASMIADGILDARILEISPNCLELMQAEFVEYVVGKSVTFSYPVLDIYLNPQKSMQGGFISAAFDNTFGVLTLFETKKIEMATIDLSVNYHRPIFVKDELIITGYIKFKGKTIVNLLGDAYNKEGKLVATAITNIMLLT